MKHRTTRLAGLLGAAALLSTAAAPALAATTVAQADANALTVSLAGNDGGTGTVTATHDGESETVEGQTQPPVGVLEGQGLLNVGVLSQQATASVEGGVGSSAACAGVAGEGGSVAQIGDSSCLVPGQPIGLTVGNLDLSGLVVFDPESALAPLNEATDPLVAEAVGPLTQQLSADVAEQLGNGGIIGARLGAVEGRCQAPAGSEATGSATIVDGALRAEFGGESVNLLDFPANPAPNTRVVTGLDEVVTVFLSALRVDLNNTLDGQAAPLAAAIDPFQAEIVDGVIAEIAPQLAPLEEDVLAATLNAQSRPAAGAIDVTALDLEVLPAAREQLDAALVGVRIGNVGCGPNGRVATPAGTTDAPDQREDLPEVPTTIASGSPASGEAPADGVLVGLALALATTVGWIGYRGLATGR